MRIDTLFHHQGTKNINDRSTTDHTEYTEESFHERFRVFRVFRGSEIRRRSWCLGG
jgi:hypothetical protein